MALIWAAWNNGQHNRSGAGYGLKVPIQDRDRLFDKEWQSVVLELPARDGFSQVKLNVEKPSFWSDACHELISVEIGRWLLTNGYAPWPKQQPPKLKIEHLGGPKFRVQGVAN